VNSSVWVEFNCADRSLAVGRVAEQQATRGNWTRETPNLQDPSTFIPSRHPALYALSTTFAPLPPSSIFVRWLSFFAERCIASPRCSPSFLSVVRGLSPQPVPCQLFNPRTQFPALPRCAIDTNAPTTAAIVLFRSYIN
jgi:hypothetical protein